MPSKSFEWISHKYYNTVYGVAGNSCPWAVKNHKHKYGTHILTLSSHTRFHFHAHTVDLVYQSSLLHTREELAMVVVGPLTLNAITFLLVLIRWGCQQIFGSLPSFTSKFIMAQGVWTVLDPLAVFAVDAILGVSHLKITWTLVHFK